MFATSLVSAALIIFALAHAPFRRSPGQIVTGIAVGLLIAAGWYATGHLGADDFNPVPVTSLTFVAPIADSLQYVMLSTGSTVNFGIAAVGGVFAGSLVTALLTGRFELESYRSPQHMLRSAGGGALMGIGGVMAFGLLDWAGIDGNLHARAGVVHRCCRHFPRHRGRSARRTPGAAAARSLAA